MVKRVVGSRQAPDRSRQKARTHRAIVDAAAAALRAGRQPTVAEAAEVAGVHRATAYRYFPTPESLLAEAVLTVGVPDHAVVFADVPPDDPVALVEAAVRAVSAFAFRDEAMFRSVVRATIDRWFAERDDPDGAGSPPVRETRRFRFVDRALEPLSASLTPADRERLRNALALVFGAEAVIVTRDVCRLDAAPATEVMVWAASALVRQAMSDARVPSERPPRVEHEPR